MTGRERVGGAPPLVIVTPAKKTQTRPGGLFHWPFSHVYYSIVPIYSYQHSVLSSFFLNIVIDIFTTGLFFCSFTQRMLKQRYQKNLEHIRTYVLYIQYTHTNRSRRTHTHAS